MGNQVLEKHTQPVRLMFCACRTYDDNHTIECIAQFTKRPLISLTISDIGTDPEDAERNLTSYFERAKLWDAIILIDEADIYMERREVQDLTRNSLVSSRFPFPKTLTVFDQKFRFPPCHGKLPDHPVSHNESGRRFRRRFYFSYSRNPILPRSLRKRSQESVEKLFRQIAKGPRRHHAGTHRYQRLHQRQRGQGGEVERP